MKKIIVLLGLSTALLIAQSYKDFAKEYHYETDYDTALKRAQVEKKDILMLMVTNYCPWCRKLEKKVFSNNHVNAFVQKNYIPLILNREEKQFHKRFHTPIVPVTYIIDYKNDTKFYDIKGYQVKSDMLNTLKNNLSLRE